MSRRSTLWLITAFLLLHNVEEAIAFHRYLPQIIERLSRWSPGIIHISYSQILLALTLATLIPLALVAWAVRRPDQAAVLWFVLLVQVVMLLNVFSHLAAALFVMRGYSPGLLTAVLINLPFSLYLLRRAASEQWLSRRALWLTLPAAILVHGPLLLGLIQLSGELVGSH
jgi:hypothetical protein